MCSLVRCEPVECGVTAVILNRPECRNALSIDLLEDLSATIDQLENDAAQRVVILRGAGPVFSSGLDLKEAADSSLVERSAECVAHALRQLQETPLIVIAAVHGGAFAGGAGMMAACDIVVASSDARIGFPEARRGLLPALICEVLKHRVREGDLRDLFLAGDPVTALRAQQIGLVQRVVPVEQLLNEAQAVARSVLAGGPQAIRKTKQLLNDLYHEIASKSLFESHLDARQSSEAIEGLTAFTEKRAPNWDGNLQKRS